MIKKPLHQPLNLLGVTIEDVLVLCTVSFVLIRKLTSNGEYVIALDLNTADRSRDPFNTSYGFYCFPPLNTHLFIYYKIKIVRVEANK